MRPVIVGKFHETAPVAMRIFGAKLPLTISVDQAVAAERRTAVIMGLEAKNGDSSSFTSQRRHNLGPGPVTRC